MHPGFPRELLARLPGSDFLCKGTDVSATLVVRVRVVGHFNVQEAEGLFPGSVFLRGVGYWLHKRLVRFASK